MHEGEAPGKSPPLAYAEHCRPFHARKRTGPTAAFVVPRRLPRSRLQADYGNCKGRSVDRVHLILEGIVSASSDYAKQMGVRPEAVDAVCKRAVHLWLDEAPHETNDAHSDFRVVGRARASAVHRVHVELQRNAGRRTDFIRVLLSVVRVGKGVNKDGTALAQQESKVSK